MRQAGRVEQSLCGHLMRAAHKKVPSSKPVGAGLSAAAGVVRDVAAAASASREPEEHETNRLLEADDAGGAREQRQDAGGSRSAPSSAKSGR
eukprot:COSAG04_NODE_12237_length_663_cov_1.274823_1_plen_91_part_01